MLRLHKAKILRTPFVYTMFGAFMHFIPSIGQEVPDRPLSRDSLYRRISHEMRAEFSSPFTYGQGSSMISVYLGDNALELARLDGFIRLALSHPDYSVGRIRLTGYCSIDGRYSYNEVLARERVEQFYAYLRGHYPALREYPYDLAWVAEDWVGLSRLVKDSSIGERDEILDIIRKVRAYDEREALLARLNGGRAYAAMKRTMLPLLRRVELQIEYKLKEQFMVQLTGRDSTATTLVDTIRELVDLTAQPILQVSTASSRPSSKEMEEEPAALYPLSFEEGRDEAVGSVGSSGRSFLFAIKTNLLSWAGIQPDFKHTAPVANVSLAYFITPHWSVELGTMYSYWRYNHNKEFQGISGYRLEPRYHLSFIEGRFGAYLGCYGRVGDYDLRTASPAESYTGDYWDVGLSAGLTVGLVGGWAAEIGTRVGYLRTDAIRYTPDGTYNWFVSRHSYGKMRVTDLNISLIYRFRGVINKRIK